MITEHIFFKFVFGPVGTAIIGGIWWTMKKIFTGIKAEWTAVTSRLERIEQIQGVQAANHLEHIEESSAKTNDLLAQIRLEQAAMNGFLKGILEK